MSLIDRFGPLIAGWNYGYASSEGTLQNITQTKLVSQPFTGWLRGVFFYTDNPAVELKVIVDNFDIEKHIFDLENSGMTFQNPTLPYLAKYDTSGNNYDIFWIPDPPLPLTKYVQVWAYVDNSISGIASAPTTANYLLEIVYEQVIDRGTFVDSLQKLGGLQKQVEVKEEIMVNRSV